MAYTKRPSEQPQSSVPEELLSPGRPVTEISLCAEGKVKAHTLVIEGTHKDIHISWTDGDQPRQQAIGNSEPGSDIHSHLAYQHTAR